MKKLLLKSLLLKNFKGTKSRKVEFKNETNIGARNGGGKTNVFDAFLWLLIDIDSEGNTGTGKGSYIKPYGKNREEIHNIETSVEGVFLLNDSNLVLKKTIKESWNDKTFKNETIYEIDNVAVKKSEYDAYLAEICDSTVMRYLLHPESFFSSKISVSDKRNFVSSLAEIPSPEISEWLSSQLESKNIDSLKKSLSATVKKSIKELESCTNRIDEVSGMIKEFDSISNDKEINVIKKEISRLQKELSSIKETEKTKNSNYVTSQQQIRKLESEKFEVERKLQAIENDYCRRKTSKLNELESEIDKLKNQNSSFGSFIKTAKESNEALSVLRGSIKESAIKLQKTVFSETEAICPTCNREFEKEQVQEIRENFNVNKVSKIENLKKETQTAKEKIGSNLVEIEKHSLLIESNNEQIIITKVKIENVEKYNFSKFKSPELESLENELAQIMIAIPKLENIDPIVIDNTELLQLIEEQNAKLNPLLEANSIKTTNKEHESRIKELKIEIKRLQKIISENKSRLKEISSYVSELMSSTEDAVNKKFFYAKVKMFETLLNGSVNDICDFTVNGVPYTPLNTASKANVKIDFQNAISRHFNVQLPCFVDNHESVGKGERLKTDLQTINLFHIEDAELSVSY